MLRKSFLALAAVLVMSAGSQANIILSTTSQDVGQGFTAFVLHAHSDDAANQTINGVASPSVSAVSQVWLNSSGAFTSPTQGDQTAGLWNSAYTPFDSYFLFNTTNSLSIGAAYSETNDGLNGATGLPAGALGAPYTGFGTMGTVGGAAGSKAFTVASGLQGTDVDLAHLVLKTGTTALFQGTILTGQGNNVTFSTANGNAFTVGAPIPEPATIGLIGLALAGGLGFIRRR